LRPYVQRGKTGPRNSVDEFVGPAALHDLMHGDVPSFPWCWCIASGDRRARGIRFACAMVREVGAAEA
jgi:hypothetical protein